MPRDYVRPAQRAAWLASLLMERPMTLRDILDEMNQDKFGAAKLRPYIETFRKAGCIYVLEWVKPKWSNYWVARYVWQDYPFKQPDAEMPT